MNMFNRSRPQSAASTHSLNEIIVDEEVPTQQNQHIEVDAVIENESIQDMWSHDPHYKFTESHPLGNILLKIVQDNTKLAEKSKLKSMVTNINELCESFYNGINMERTKVNTQLNNTVTGVEKSMLDRELNSHTINASVPIPHYFSPVPVITSPQKLTEVIKIFPKSGKFSGNLQRDSNYSVVEFLIALTTAQAQCNLSESEFLDRMLAATTGLAHDLVLDWKTSGDNCSIIYHSLVVNFDTRIPAEDAKNKLTTFVIGKNSTLAKAESQIQQWVGRAATLLPPGDSRIAYKNMEGCTTLIKALPAYSSLQAHNLYQSLTAKLGRACTMQEFFRGLDMYRSLIDKDIKVNGANLMPNFQRRNNNPRNQIVLPHKNALKYSNFLSSFSNSVTQNETKVPHFKRSNSNSQNKSQQGGMAKYNDRQNGQRWDQALNTQRQTQYTPGAAYNRGQRSKSYGGVSKHNNNYNVNRRSFQNNKFDRNNQCTLCGQKHQTTDCTNMKDNTGKTLTIIPTYGFCSSCPQWVKPRLRHPEVVCPYRVGGPLYRKSQRA